MGDFKYFDTWEDANEWREKHGTIKDDCIVMDCQGKEEWPCPIVYIPQAIGAYQIHKIYIDDCNRISQLRSNPVRFNYEDRWDKRKSREMVKIYLLHYFYIAFENSTETLAPWETIARIHNGGPNGWKKPSTKAYWLKIKARLKSHNDKGVPK